MTTGIDDWSLTGGGLMNITMDDSAVAHIQRKGGRATIDLVSCSS